MLLLAGYDAVFALAATVALVPLLLWLPCRCPTARHLPAPTAGGAGRSAAALLPRGPPVAHLLAALSLAHRDPPAVDLHRNCVPVRETCWLLLPPLLPPHLLRLLRRRLEGALKSGGVACTMCARRKLVKSTTRVRCPPQGGRPAGAAAAAQLAFRLRGDRRRHRGVQTVSSCWSASEQNGLKLQMSVSSGMLLRGHGSASICLLCIPTHCPPFLPPPLLQLYPVWRGWMWAGVLAIFGYCYAVIHHQLFWWVSGCL